MTLPYFTLYPKDFEAKTAWLTLAQDGAYNRLLRLCWMTPGCTLPNDKEWIARRLRVSTHSAKGEISDFDRDVLPVLDDFFKVKRGRYVNDRLYAEFRKAKTKYKNKSKAVKTAVAAKALKNNKKSVMNSTRKQGENQNQNQNHSKREDKPLSHSARDLFLEFWEGYPDTLGQGRDLSIHAWRSLSPDEQEHAVRSLPEYGRALQDRDRNARYPHRYLIEKIFLDIRVPETRLTVSRGSEEWAAWDEYYARTKPFMAGRPKYVVATPFPPKEKSA